MVFRGERLLFLHGNDAIDGFTQGNCQVSSADYACRAFKLYIGDFDLFVRRYLIMLLLSRVPSKKGARWSMPPILLVGGYRPCPIVSFINCKTITSEQSSHMNHDLDFTSLLICVYDRPDSSIRHSNVFRQPKPIQRVLNPLKISGRTYPQSFQPDEFWHVLVHVPWHTVAGRLLRRQIPRWQPLGVRCLVD